MLLSCFKHRFSLIGLSETWLKEGEGPLFQLPDYKFVTKCRNDRRGGGVGIYVKSDLHFHRRTDLEESICGTEVLCIEVHHRKMNQLVFVMYRPPGEPVNEFLKSIESSLNKVQTEKKKCFILGDFNIDLLNPSTPSKNLLDTLYSYSFCPLISKPTRITKRSATLLDNIFTNCLENVLQSGIFTSDISDHFAVFCTLKADIKHNNNTNFKRKINDCNIASFCMLLKKQDWGVLENISDVDSKFNAFLDIYSSLYDNCFPVTKIINRPSKNDSKPWFNDPLKKLCKKKYLLFKKFVKNPNSVSELKYKHARNLVNKEKRRCKHEYYMSKFESVKGNLKYTWNVINELLNKSKNKSQCEAILVNDRTLENKQDIANEFNKYFNTVGTNIVKNLPGSNINFKSFLKDANSKSMYFVPIKPSEVLDIVNAFDNNKSPGSDDIHPRVFKQSITFILKPLCNIFNLSLERGIFPQNLKRAKVIPVYKKGEHNKLNNYRPISLLSIFSKTLENWYTTDLYHFLIKIISCIKDNLVSGKAIQLTWHW